MDVGLVAKSLCFHGQPLQKMWEGERGNHDLSRIGLSNPDYSVYTARQKSLTFQYRAKRLKLHKFISRKATTLFDSGLVEELPVLKRKEKLPNGISVTMPPFETFLNQNIDKSRHVHHILGAIQPGDIVYGAVIAYDSNGLIVNVLCTGEPIVRYLADLNVIGYATTQNMIPAHDKKGNPKLYRPNNFVCCEVLDISAEAFRMTLGMKGALTIDVKVPLGLITSKQLPEYYKKSIDNAHTNFVDLLEGSKAFQNPGCVNILFQEVGLDFSQTFSNLNTLKYQFAVQEYASELRQMQASKWAFRYIADGLENFKFGRNSEAFQCFNKALNLDPRNVEGLVARGALHASSGSYRKAVEDFEIALKLNPYHANALKYMGETLVALGRSYEEDNRIDEARTAYKGFLEIISQHEQAKSSLDILNDRTGTAKQVIDTRDLMLAGKKEKLKERKRKSSSSSSSDDSNNSSNKSSSSKKSSDSSSDSDSSTRALSPLSKRMSLIDKQNCSSGASKFKFNQPFQLANARGPPSDNYDVKVKNLLEMTRDEDDYGSEVRKLVEEASKYRKERKLLDEKIKKEQKKLKKESKKRRKEGQTKDKLSLSGVDNKEALKIFKSFPKSDIGNKFNADLAKYGKSIEVLQKRCDTSSTLKAFQKTYEDEFIEEPKHNIVAYNTFDLLSRENSKLDKTIKRDKFLSNSVPSTSVKRPTTPPLSIAPIQMKINPLPTKVLPKTPIVFECYSLDSSDDQQSSVPAVRRSRSVSRHRYSRSRSHSRSRRRRHRSRRSSSLRRSRSPPHSTSVSRSPRQSRSRSRSHRRMFSRHRSRSRSRGRRSHSPRRWNSRTRSRSYSRSRSRSRTWRRGDRSESSKSNKSSEFSSDSDSSLKHGKKFSDKTKQRSVSPLSKRIAIMHKPNFGFGDTKFQFNQPFHLANAAGLPPENYDAKVFFNILFMKSPNLKFQEKQTKEKLPLRGIDSMDLKESLQIGNTFNADLAKYEMLLKQHNEPFTSKTFQKTYEDEFIFRRRDAPSTSKAFQKPCADELVDNTLKRDTFLSNPVPSTSVKRLTTPPPPILSIQMKINSLPTKVLQKPPIVYDIFGFRVASSEDQKCPVPAPRRSRSVSRDRYSRSRSRSRSRRRSRSLRRSISTRGSRSMTRSRSRSPTRSRSRSRSFSRRRSSSRSSRLSRSYSKSRSPPYWGHESQQTPI